MNYRRKDFSSRCKHSYI